jgi:hypothetical protein
MTTAYSDGASHTISTTISDDILVSGSGTALTIGAGAAITPPAPAPTAPVPHPVGLHGIVVAPDGGAPMLAVAGGAITGGTPAAGADRAGAGVFAHGGSVSLTGGATTGGAGFFPGAGLHVEAAGPVAVSGGSLSGGDFAGDGTTQAGGVGLLYQGPNSLSIAGGSFAGGDGPAGRGASAIFFGTGAVSIAGGTFTDPVTCSADRGGGASIGISGGTFGALNLYASEPGAVAVVSGGSIAGPLVVCAGDGGRVDFLGSLTYSGGRLTGTLQSGDAIDVAVTAHLGGGATAHAIAGGFRFGA